MAKGEGRAAETGSAKAGADAPRVVDEKAIDIGFCNALFDLERAWAKLPPASSPARHGGKSLHHAPRRV